MLSGGVCDAVHHEAGGELKVKRWGCGESGNEIEVVKEGGRGRRSKKKVRELKGS